MKIIKSIILFPYLIIHKIVFKIAPIKNNRYVFMSYHGKYSDSPMYISEQLHSLNPSTEIIWLVKKEIINSLPSYILTKDISKLTAWWYLGSAQVIVDNVYCNKGCTWFADAPLSGLMYKVHKYLFTKSKQHAYTTFHGTPLKKMDRDQVGNDIRGFICPNTTLLLESQYSAKLYNHLTFNNVPIEVLGSPRIEKLNQTDEYKILGIKEKLGVKPETRLILYAPTFRNDGKDTQGKNLYRSGLDQLYSMKIDILIEALQDKFGGDWKFLVRFHQHVEKLVDWEELNKLYPGVLINGNQIEEMNDCLSASDILLTDYSSCMFDYLVLKRPCFLYVPDLERYSNVERGLYFDIKKMPFSSATNFDELLYSIQSFDNIRFLTELDLFKKQLGYTEIIGSTERIVNYILATR